MLSSLRWLRTLSRFNVHSFALMFVLINLRRHGCYGLENVEKLVVPLDVSILRGYGFHSASQVMRGNEAASGDKSRRFDVIKPFLVDVDLSILAPREPPSLHQHSSNHHSSTSKIIQKPHYGLPGSWGPLSSNQESSNVMGLYGRTQWLKNPRHYTDTSLHTNKVDLPYRSGWEPGSHKSKERVSFGFDGPQSFRFNHHSHHDSEKQRPNSAPVVEDALTDFLRESHYNDYEPEEIHDYDRKAVADEMGEEYGDDFEDPYDYGDQELENTIMPLAEKKSSQEREVTTIKRSRPSWIVQNGADYWRMAHKMRREKPRRKYKRFVKSDSVRDHYIAKHYLEKVAHLP